MLLIFVPFVRAFNLYGIVQGLGPIVLQFLTLNSCLLLNILSCEFCSLESFEVFLFLGLYLSHVSGLQDSQSLVHFTVMVWFCLCLQFLFLFVTLFQLILAFLIYSFILLNFYLHGSLFNYFLFHFVSHPSLVPCYQFYFPPCYCCHQFQMCLITTLCAIL